MQEQDFVKLAYQAAFGTDFTFPNNTEAWQKIFDATPAADKPLFEIISPDYCRINIAAWKHRNLKAAWLFNMFKSSVKSLPDSEEIFNQYIKDITNKRTIHLSGAMEHSEIYKQLYSPSYCIVSTRFLQVIPILYKLANTPPNKPYIIVIDGRAASGKTTFSKQLAMITGTDTIHMDDFFLPVEMRTAQRMSEPGGNVHYERFKTEVIPNLRKSVPFAYQCFDCSKMQLGKMRTLSGTPWKIIEGAYSMHPTFGNYADLKIFYDISPEEQIKRIRIRNGDKKAAVFTSKWIPLEEKYISTFNIRKQADIVIGNRD